MKLQRVDEAIEACKNHLIKSSAMETEIEAYLTRYLLILICAAYEEEIEKLFAQRASQTQDPYIVAFVSSTVRTKFRNPTTSKIVEMLGLFSLDYKEKFREKVTGTRQETFFNNIVTNRHSTAHSSGSNITFNELVNSYNEAHGILDTISEVLGISSINKLGEIVK